MTHASVSNCTTEESTGTVKILLAKGQQLDIMHSERTSPRSRNHVSRDTSVHQPSVLEDASETGPMVSREKSRSMLFRDALAIVPENRGVSKETALHVGGENSRGGWRSTLYLPKNSPIVGA